MIIVNESSNKKNKRIIEQSFLYIYMIKSNNNKYEKLYKK
jgi:hypothetical protein